MSSPLPDYDFQVNIQTRKGKMQHWFFDQTPSFSQRQHRRTQTFGKPKPLFKMILAYLLLQRWRRSTFAFK